MKTPQQHTCPWWLGFLLINPIRKRLHNPESMLKPFVKPGMKVVDFGCAMGFFSLPMARMVGETGKVYAVDIQEKMIQWLSKRAAKAKLSQIIHPMLITEETNYAGLSGSIDFALLFAMVHEVPDKAKLFATVGNMVKSGGHVLFAEPRGHVTKIDFEESIILSFSSGFKEAGTLNIAGSHAVILQKV
jgi:2-polyprenyl-3-methyl-5-hydroxy-6-metoxy-1,4-benzoquinol methylase